MSTEPGTRVRVITLAGVQDGTYVGWSGWVAEDNTLMPAFTFDERADRTSDRTSFAHRAQVLDATTGEPVTVVRT